MVAAVATVVLVLASDRWH